VVGAERMLEVLRRKRWVGGGSVEVERARRKWRRVGELEGFGLLSWRRPAVFEARNSTS